MSRAKKWADRTTTRTDIERAVAQRLDIPQERVSDVLCECLNEIAEGLANGQRVELRRFAVFTPKTLAGKQMVSVQTGQAVDLEPRLTVGFKPSPGLVALVRGEVA